MFSSLNIGLERGEAVCSITVQDFVWDGGGKIHKVLIHKQVIRRKALNNAIV